MLPDKAERLKKWQRWWLGWFFVSVIVPLEEENEYERNGMDALKFVEDHYLVYRPATNQWETPVRDDGPAFPVTGALGPSA